MREDKFGALLEELFATTDEPLSATEAAVRVGCSKQRAYAWIEANSAKLAAKGKRKFGGIGYIAKTNPVWNLRKDSTGEAVIEVGTQLTVVGVSVQGGRVAVIVQDNDGGTSELVAASA